MTPKERELCEDAANFCALHGDPLHAAAIRAALRETRETPTEETSATLPGYALLGNRPTVASPPTGEAGALREALERLVIDANRLCDRGLGGTYEGDCRRSIEQARAALSSLTRETKEPTGASEPSIWIQRFAALAPGDAIQTIAEDPSVLISVQRSICELLHQVNFWRDGERASAHEAVKLEAENARLTREVAERDALIAKLQAQRNPPGEQEAGMAARAVVDVAADDVRALRAIRDCEDQFKATTNGAMPWR